MSESRRMPNTSRDAVPLLARRQGYEFVLTDDLWRLSKGVTVQLSWARRLLHQRHDQAFRKVLGYFSENYSPGYVRAINYDFKKFVTSVIKQKGHFSGPTVADLINYRAQVGEQHLEYLYRVSRVLRYWHDQCLAEVSPDVVDLLNCWKLKGNVKGMAVRTKCPYAGPLTDIEFDALQGALYAAMEGKAIRFSTFALVMLFCATGRRPCQLRDLKLKDFVCAKAEDGLAIYILRIPRAKQSGRGEDPWRDEFKDVALEPELGYVIATLIDQVKERVRKLIPSVTEELLQETPLFPNWHEFLNAGSASQSNLLAAMRLDFFHRATSSVSFTVSRCIDRLTVHSERLSEPMHVFPYRLRRTLGSRAAREGYGELVIAELLDHTDTQNVRVYTENVPENVNAINVATAKQLAPIAQAFSGVLVDTEAQAKRGGDVASRVKTSDGAVAGTCGKFGFCGALAPIACYTCMHFQPWLDGPHERMLEDLVRENERIRMITGDKTISSINDRTLLAIADVVRLCDRRKAELARG